jgi:hypothetical protein
LIYSSDIAISLAYSAKLEVFKEGIRLENHYALPCEHIGCGRRKRTIRFCAKHELINKAPDTGCSVEGCDGSLFSKGFCKKHYHDNRRDRLNPERKKVGRSGWYVDIRNKVYSGELDIPEKGKSISSGINFKKPQQKWLASFVYKTKTIPIGYFDTRELAEQAKIDFFSSKSSPIHRYSTILKGSEIADGFRIKYRTQPVFIDWEVRGKEDRIFNLLQSKNEKIERLFARKLSIKDVPNAKAKEFLSKFHIQGSPKNIIDAIGLYLDEELMMVATISRHHRNVDKLVLSRFCSKSGFVIVGGLSRLSKCAFKRHGSLISWVDLRWGGTDSYEKAGWIKDARIASDYFYLDPVMQTVISKQSRKKGSVNTPAGMTEAEHAKKDGLIRVYDCGKVRLIYNG